MNNICKILGHKNLIQYQTELSEENKSFSLGFCTRCGFKIADSKLIIDLLRSIMTDIGLWCNEDTISIYSQHQKSFVKVITVETLKKSIRLKLK